MNKNIMTVNNNGIKVNNNGLAVHNNIMANKPINFNPMKKTNIICNSGIMLKSNEKKIDYIKECHNSKYSKPISFESNKIILEQMEKCVCRIKLPLGSGTGFFCMIPFPDKFKLLPVLITNNHVIGEDPNSIDIGAKIDLFVKKGNKPYTIVLDKNRKIYTNEKIDATIIELRPNDNLDIDFMQVELKDGRPS